MILPSIDDIIKLNRYHIDSTGGHYKKEVNNLLNRGSLEWAFAAINAPLFNYDKYPSFIDKISLISWTIIKNHVFYDGNKRTGISVLLIAIDANDFVLNATEDDLIQIALKIANSDVKNFTFDEFTNWVRDRIYPKYIIF